MIEVDARGLSCPIPVVRTQKALDEHPQETVAVLVDSNVPKENVTRLAASKGYSVETEKTADGFKLTLKPSSKRPIG
ncbi:MAG: SirA family protein [Chloroflexi bacterium]|nr:SirA family protein [Chloroflexota bacterium]